MSDEKRDLQAAEFVLGTLAPDARLAFAEALEQDQDLQNLVQLWEERLSGLDGGTETEAPSPGLWTKIESRLDQEAGPTVTIRQGEGAWVEIMAGVQKKSLVRDEARGEESYLLQIAPGTTVPLHGHEKIEECLVMSGDFVIGDIRLGAGDFHAAMPGSQHPNASTEGGAVLYIRGEIRDTA